jgi:hypothetical protein
MTTNILLPALWLGPNMSRNLGKIPKLSMSLALPINAQITHPLYDGLCKP